MKPIALKLTVKWENPRFPGRNARETGILLNLLAVEGRVGEIDVFLIHAVFCQADRFAEAYRMQKNQTRHRIWTRSRSTRIT